MTLGLHLKNRRQELGKSLEQLAASTKIHIKILSGIEEDRYTDLPARAYIRGLIVNYAKALKLDPNALLETYHEFLESKFAERPDRDHGHKDYAFEGREIEQNRRWMAVGGSIAAVFAIAVLLIFKPENHRRREKHKEFEGEPVAEIQKDTRSSPLPAAEVPAPARSAPALAFEGDEITSSRPQDRSKDFLFPLKNTSPMPEVKTPVAASSSPAAVSDPLNKGDGLTAEETKLKILLTAKEDAWIRYRSDELPIGLLILRKGRTLIIRAKERLRFETRHPEHFLVKTRSVALSDLDRKKVELGTDASLQDYSGREFGLRELPEEVPPPKAP